MKKQTSLSIETTLVEKIKLYLYSLLSGILMLTFLAGMILVLTGCETDDNAVDEQIPETNTIQLVTDIAFGNILTDANGMSLYFFSKDVKGASECNDGCLDAWPIFYTADLKLDEGLDTTDFDVITREDGAKQNTYKGWPLYYFASDNEAGDINGDGAGSNWFIAKPDYSLMYSQADIDGTSTFYITNATGRAIYLFANDTNNKNNYTNDDFSNNANWPVISLEIDLIPSILNRDDFDTIDVSGTTQVTYKGWPLYYFGNDTERGDINGVGTTWPIVNTDTSQAPELAAKKL